MIVSAPHSGTASACGHAVLGSLSAGAAASAAQRARKSRQWRKKSIQYPSEPASYDKSLSVISTSYLRVDRFLFHISYVELTLYKRPPSEIPLHLARRRRRRSLIEMPLNWWDKVRDRLIQLWPRQ